MSQINHSLEIMLKDHSIYYAGRNRAQESTLIFLKVLVLQFKTITKGGKENIRVCTLTTQKYMHNIKSASAFGHWVSGVSNM